MTSHPSSRSKSTEEHRVSAQSSVGVSSINVAVLTVSDTRTEETDRGGLLIRDLLTEAESSPFRVVAYTIVKDDAPAIDAQLDGWIADPEVSVIITTGGTGISRRDTTIEVVERKLTAILPGFGELFRMLSWEEVKAAAMLSRAVAGLAVPLSSGKDDSPTDTANNHSENDTFIFALPGSTNAIRLAMTQLIIPELPHLIWERKR